MNTGPAERLSYRDLAKQGARIQRTLAVAELHRLAALLSAPEDAAAAGLEGATQIDVDLRFSLGAEGVPAVTGNARLAVVMLCNRCAETVRYPLTSTFSLCLADESRASELTETRDVLVVHGADVSVAEIVEDELLLALPERLCTEEPCLRRPRMDYPAQVEATREQAANARQESPFAELAALRGRVADGSEDGRD